MMSNEQVDVAAALIRAARTQPASVGEPVRWEYRWTNPDNRDVEPYETRWQLVEAKNSNSDKEVADQLSQYRYKDKPTYKVRALYVVPQPTQSQAVPLTDEQVNDLVNSAGVSGRYGSIFADGVRWGVRAYERKQGIKGDKHETD